MINEEFLFDFRNTDDDDEEEEEDLWDENDEWWNCRHVRDNNSETVQREMVISNIYAGVVIGRSF